MQHQTPAMVTDFIWTGSIGASLPSVDTCRNINNDMLNDMLDGMLDRMPDSMTEIMRNSMLAITWQDV